MVNNLLSTWMATAWVVFIYFNVRSTAQIYTKWALCAFVSYNTCLIFSESIVTALIMCHFVISVACNSGCFKKHSLQGKCEACMDPLGLAWPMSTMTLKSWLGVIWYFLISLFLLWNEGKTWKLDNLWHRDKIFTAITLLLGFFRIHSIILICKQTFCE